MDIGKDYFKERTFNLIKNQEYDSELDKLKAELYVCVEEDKRNKIELESLQGTLERMQGRLEREPQNIYKAIGIFLAVTVFWFIWSLNGNNVLLSWASGLVDVFKIVLLLNVFRRIYLYLYHSNPKKVKRIEIIAREKSLTHTIEELEVQINEIQRKILESYKRIRQLKEEITTLEENE
ncbi:MAG: hypothetical protein IJD02_02460 [Lachnospiraceae bacterium]|nr:hypothetical protein [Lachnospiraceae bacterium]